MTTFIRCAAIALALSTFALPAAGQAQQAKPASAASSGAIVKVNGLVCDFCVQALTRTFKREAAVDGFDMDLDSKEIRMTFKPGMTMDDAAIRKVVTNAGYSVVGISRTGGGA
jgi:copper chaperone CopZ